VGRGSASASKILSPPEFRTMRSWTRGRSLGSRRPVHIVECGLEELEGRPARESPAGL
jgi:hypothetical protein